MAIVTLAPALARWLTPVPQAAAASVRCDLPGGTLRELFHELFHRYPHLQGYVLDETQIIRHHVVVFVDGLALLDKAQLDLPISPDSEVYLAQALSGG